MNCTDLFQQIDGATNLRLLTTKADSYCLDPASTSVSGSSAFTIKRSVMLTFLPCLADNDRDPSLQCYSRTEIEAWSKINVPRAELFSSFSFVDFEDQDQPLKHSVSYKSVGSLMAGTTADLSSPVLVHQMAVYDDMMSPFPFTTFEADYLTLEKVDAIVTTTNTLSQAEIDSLPDE